MYPGFDQPGGTLSWDVTDWSDWLLTQPNLYIPVRPAQTLVCNVCWGPTPEAPDGTTYSRCWNCRQHGRVAGLVPISYSWNGGLEAAIWRAKHGSPWLNRPLAAVLNRFLGQHFACIERRYGRIHRITLVPSHPENRNGWDHLRDLYEQCQEWPYRERWDLDVLQKASVAGADTLRTEANASRFIVRNDPWGFRGERWLLIDDTWTSGGTLNSAAAAIIAAGGLPPVALTIGRQFRPTDGRFKDFCDSLELGQPDALDEACALELTSSERW